MARGRRGGRPRGRDLGRAMTSGVAPSRSGPGWSRRPVGSPRSSSRWCICGASSPILFLPGILARFETGGDGGRPVYYAVALRMFADSPLLGLGPGTWAARRVGVHRGRRARLRHPARSRHLPPDRGRAGHRRARGRRRGARLRRVAGSSVRSAGTAPSGVAGRWVAVVGARLPGTPQRARLLRQHAGGPAAGRDPDRPARRHRRAAPRAAGEARSLRRARSARRWLGVADRRLGDRRSWSSGGARASP